MRVTARILLTAAVAVFLCVAGPAWGLDVPLRNWEVPRSPMGDLDHPSAFVPVTPCRIADTRGVPPFTGAYAGPELAAGATRNFDVDGAPTCAGIAPLATAYSLNFTIIGSAGVYQNAFLTVWPTGGTMPTVSTLNFDGGQLKANAAVVPPDGTGSISVYVNANAHLIIDINGYFTNRPNTNNQFLVSGSFHAAAAISGFNYSSTNASHGVGGYAGGAGRVHGVQGEISSNGQDGSAGVHGIGADTTRLTFGVFGESASGHNDGAGVLGRVTFVTPPVVDTNAYSEAGVRGEGADIGTLGIAGPSGWGTVGASVDSSGYLQRWGILGYGTSYGVYAFGDVGASGTKPFVEPHPTDATKVIKYVALEGNEAGTYFRGTGFTENGVYVIEVPESFRMVSDEEGLTVQVTTVGSPARAWVESESLERIVIRSSADTKFHYLVQGVRRAYKDWQVIVPGDEFVPRSETDRLPLWLSEDGKRRLISNGTFNPDGTVNLETAERLGWTREWREREAGQK